MGEIAYRKLNADDALSIMPMIEAFCRETNADDEAVGAIMKRLNEGKTTVFVAENGNLLGIAGYCIAGEAIVPDFFYVRPDKRQGIIGGMLYKKAAAYAKRYQGAKKIVPIVTEDKERLYTKIGFKRKFILLEKEI